MMKSAQEWNNEGKALLNQKKLEEANKCFDEAITLDPGLMDAYNNKYSILFNGGHFEEVIALCDKALQVEPTDSMSLFSKGRALYSNKNYPEALECLDRTIELYPNWAVPYNTKGNALRFQGKPDEAIESLLKASELDPQYVYPLRNISLIYDEQGKLEEALNYIEKAIELDPKDAHYLLDKADYLKKLGRKSEALETFKKANKLYAEGSFNIDLIPTQTQWIKQTITSLEELEKAHAQAEASIKYADQADPAVKNLVDHLTILQKEIEKVSHQIVDQMGHDNNANSKNALLAELQNLKGELFGVQQQLGIASTRTAQDWYKEGKALLQQRRFAEANKCFSEAIELDPSLKDAYNDKYSILFNEGKFAEVITWCDKALQVNPKDSMALFSKGRAFYSQKQYPEALVWLDKAIELYPNWAVPYNTKGNVLRFQGKPDEAIKSMEKSAALSETYVYPLRNIALIYEEQGNLEEAIKYIDKAIERDPKDAHYLIDKGAFLKKLDRKEEALEVFKKASKLYAQGSFNIDLIPTQIKWIKDTLDSLDDIEKAQLEAEASIQGADQSNPAVKNLVNDLVSLQKELDEVSNILVDQIGNNDAVLNKSFHDQAQKLKDQLTAVQQKLLEAQAETKDFKGELEAAKGSSS